jgi:hypothetical protein
MITVHFGRKSGKIKVNIATVRIFPIAAVQKIKRVADGYRPPAMRRYSPNIVREIAFKYQNDWL